MHVVDVGRGTPLVALHGFGVDHRILIGLDAAFEAAGGWRRLYPDLPGTAQTPIGDAASTADVVGLVSQMLDEQVGTEPFAILGSSWGGLIARQIAHERRSQVLGLALLVPLVVADPESRDAPDRVVLHEDPEAAGSLGELRAEYEAMSVVQSSENVELWSQYVWSGAEGIDTVGQERIRERYGVEPVPEERWPEPFLTPTLICTGRQDHVTGFRDAWRLLDHYPRATFATLDSAGHNVHLDRPSPVNALLRDWLERIRAEQ